MSVAGTPSATAPSPSSIPCSSSETELGVIATLRKHFGFIKSPSRSLDLFFHHSDLHAELQPSDLVQGLEVLFTPSQDPVSKRLVAKHISRAAPGSVVFHEVSERQYLGQVVELELPPSPAWSQGEAGRDSNRPQHQQQQQQHAALGTSSETGRKLHGAAPAPAQPQQREATGILRYRPQEGKVLHLVFRLADVLPGCAAQLRLNCMVLFNICTDRRAAASGARAGAASGRACHHAANRAVQIMVLDAGAAQYLEPGMLNDMTVLGMLGEAFPFGTDISRERCGGRD